MWIFTEGGSLTPIDIPDTVLDSVTGIATLRMLTSVPVSRWPEYLDDADLALVAPYMDAVRKDEKLRDRQQRKATRRARYRRS